MMLTVTGGGMTSSQQAAGLAGSRYKQIDREKEKQTQTVKSTNKTEKQIDKEKEKNKHFLNFRI